jgi:DNA (cytosine-5)-methyltransferase 1
MQFARLNALKPGQGLRDLPIDLQTKGGYSGAYGRLTKDMVAPTITRWVFHPGSGRWGHPKDIRVLTIREVARIQSFPDSFEFIGSYNDQAGQLGNAVPPILIKALIDALLVQTQSSKDDKSAAKSAKDNISLGSGKSKWIA